MPELEVKTPQVWHCHCQKCPHPVRLFHWVGRNLLAVYHFPDLNALRQMLIRNGWSTEWQQELLDKRTLVRGDEKTQLYIKRSKSHASRT